MKLFRRSKPVQPDVPPEVAEYYQAERRERSGMAWLLTAATLVMTVLVVVGLFLASRWLVRTIRHNRNDSPVATTTTPSSNQTTPSVTNDSSSSSSTSDDASGASNTGTDSDTSTTNKRENSAQSETGSSSATAPHDSTSPSQSAPTNAGKSSDEQLANTGPGDTILATFVLMGGVSYVWYRAKLVRNN